MTTEKQKNKRTADLWKNLLCFTLLYGLLVVIGCVICAHYGKSIIWRLDGAQQHFTSFVYARQMVQSMLSGTFSPYTFTVGEGVDVLTTLNCYGLTDPFTYIGLLFGENQQVLAFSVRTLMKMYATGVFCFFYMGNLRKKFSMETVLSALVYITTGYCLLVGFACPNFYCCVTYLPLVLLGVDLVFVRKKEGILTLAVALLALSDYYSLYMVTTMAGVYILVCLFLRRGEGFRKCFTDLLHLAGFYLLGIGCAAVSLLPAAYAVLQNCRAGLRTGYTDSLLVFPLDYYKNLYLSLLTYNTDFFSTVPGLASSTFLLLGCFVFAKRKEWTWQKIGLALLFLCLCIPLVGLIENGFGYVTNRWSCALILMCAGCCGLGIEEVLTHKTGQKSLALASFCSLVYAATLILIVALQLLSCNLKGYRVRVALVLMFTVVAFNVIVRIPKEVLRKRLLYLCIYSTIALNIIFFSTPYGSNYISLTDTVAEADAVVTGGMLGNAKELSQENFYRIECTNLRNEGLTRQKNITSSWWSIMDKQRMSYYQTMELPTLDQNCRLEGLGANAALTTLASVRYYLPKMSNAPIPYGYTLLRKDGETPLYENKYALPLGYCYSGYLTETEFMELPTVQKYQALTQAVVLSDEDAHGSVVPHVDYQTDILPVEYAVQSNSSVEITGGEIRVKEKGGSFALEFEAPEGYEVYIRFGGLKQTQKDSIGINLECEGMESSLSVKDKQMMWYAPMSGYTCKIADGKVGKQTCTICFKDTGVLTYDTIELWALPVQTYVDAVEKLGETVMNVEEMQGAYIRGSINATEPSLLNLSIPYVHGWTAYVDGEEAHLVRTNTYYMGLMLENGEHTIELKYETPYLKIGIAVSVLSILGVVLVLCMGQRKARKA